MNLNLRIQILFCIFCSYFHLLLTDCPVHKGTKASSKYSSTHLQHFLYINYLHIKFCWWSVLRFLPFTKVSPSNSSHESRSALIWLIDVLAILKQCTYEQKRHSTNKIHGLHMAMKYIHVYYFLGSYKSSKVLHYCNHLQCIK